MATEIAEEWQAYAIMKALQVRQVTLDSYAEHLSLYMGYNLQHDPFPRPAGISSSRFHGSGDISPGRLPAWS